MVSVGSHRVERSEQFQMPTNPEAAWRFRAFVIGYPWQSIRPSGIPIRAGS
jgi:hypothetical protein